MNDLSQKHFRHVLEQAFEQVFAGKGAERHGHGDNFDKQPWKIITDNVGEGFCLGQAIKKLMELRSLSKDESWERDALGAIVYITMAIMYRQHKASEDF